MKYMLWKRNGITAIKVMEMLNLKKNSFYNLVTSMKLILIE